MDSPWFRSVAQSSSMGAATLAFAWEDTPLGPISSWGQSLRQSVRMCFSTKFPVMIAWGPELTMIYNDGYRDMLGSHKKLTALGAPMAQVWEEIWDDIGPMVDQVMGHRQPIWVVDTPLLMNRSDFVEETYFTFSYSPLVDDDDEIAGILDIATETTEQVISQHRLTLIDALHAHLQAFDGGAEALAGAATEVLESSADLARTAVLTRTGPGVAFTVAGDVALIDSVPNEVIDRVLSTQKTAVAGSTVVVALSAQDRGDADGVLLAEAAPTRRFDAELRSFTILAASAIAGALRSATAQQVQLDFYDARARVSELEATRAHESSLALQVSMLTDPPEPDHLHVVVRYRPAADDLTVGGDWYDAFLTQDGATTLVIGDVTGHDLAAAAAMGQLRGLIRAIAYDSGTSPARVLERTDRAIVGLNLGRAATATSVVARIEQPTTDVAEGTRTVRWSNAGHPHPVLIRADGTLETLARQNDILLGILTETTRTEHTVDLTDGDTLFLYTDGLIERRGTSMRESHRVLMSALEGGHDKTLDELAEHVLAALAPVRGGDDVALVLVRPFPEDQPRPAQAGPNRNVPSTLT